MITIGIEYHRCGLMIGLHIKWSIGATNAVQAQDGERGGGGGGGTYRRPGDGNDC